MFSLESLVCSDVFFVFFMFGIMDLHNCHDFGLVIRTFMGTHLRLIWITTMIYIHYIFKNRLVASTRRNDSTSICLSVCSISIVLIDVVCLFIIKLITFFFKKNISNFDDLTILTILIARLKCSNCLDRR